MKKVYLFLGKSCAGKTFLASKLAEDSDKTVLKSYTNRPQRDELSDIDHIFVTQDFYDKCKADDNIAAETVINGYFYFSTKEQLQQADFYVINPEAVKSLLAQNLEDVEFIIIYITCDDEIRRKRFLKRKNSSVALFYSRLYAEETQFTEFEAEKGYDYLLDTSSSDSEVLNVLNRILKYESGTCNGCFNEPCENEVKEMKNVRKD